MPNPSWPTAAAPVAGEYLLTPPLTLGGLIPPLASEGKAGKFFSCANASGLLVRGAYWFTEGIRGGGAAEEPLVALLPPTAPPNC